MWTCGIDIATQHATPATHSSACSAAGEKPSGRSDGAAATGGPCAAPSVRRDRRPVGAAAGRSASGSIATSAENADADVGRAPADGVDEVLDDRRPHGAGEIVAARADRDGDAAAAREPHATCRATSGTNVAELPRSRSARPARALKAQRLPAEPAAMNPAPRPTVARRAPEPSRRSGRTAGPSGCRRGRSRSSSAYRAARHRRARRRTRLQARQRPRRPNTCRRRRWS